MRIAAATIATFVLAAAAPLAASAQCPSRADVQASGIVVGFDDGSRIIYREMEPDIVIEIVRFDNPADDFWVQSRYGFWPTVDGAFANGSPDPSNVNVTRFPVAMEELPPIGPNVSWQGPVTYYAINQLEPTGTDNFIATIGDYHALVIGDCVYEALSAETAYVSDGNTGSNAFLEIVPELGVTILVGDGDYGAPANSTYAPISIKALP